MLLELPAIVKIIAVFVFILALTRYKISLYICLFSAAAAVGLWMGQGPVETVHLVLVKSLSGESLWLAVIIVEIIVLSHLLKEGRQMERIVNTFKAISFGNRFTLACLPAIIGLLPMPGGALFSAPMVESSAAGSDLSAELKTAINYWFRHIWEYWWPLYPGLILAISLLNVEPWRLIAAQFPLCLGVLVSGNIFLLSACPKKKSNTTPSRKDVKRFLYELIPFGLVIFAMFGLDFIIDYIPLPFAWPKYLNFLIGLILAQGWVIKTNNLPPLLIKKALFHRSTLNMALIILGIMAFKGILIETHIIVEIQEELIRYHIPTVFVVAALPFISGLVMGIAIGFVGSSYPLIIVLLQGQIQGAEMLAYSTLAYGFGYMGMMMSPVHLCLLVSKDYFHADLAGTYKLLIKPMVFVLVWTVFLFMVYKTVFAL